MREPSSLKSTRPDGPYLDGGGKTITVRLRLARWRGVGGSAVVEPVRYCGSSTSPAYVGGLRLVIDASGVSIARQPVETGDRARPIFTLAWSEITSLEVVSTLAAGDGGRERSEKAGSKASGSEAAAGSELAVLAITTSEHEHRFLAARDQLSILGSGHLASTLPSHQPAPEGTGRGLHAPPPGSRHQHSGRLRPGRPSSGPPGSGRPSSGRLRPGHQHSGKRHADLHARGELLVAACRRILRDPAGTARSLLELTSQARTRSHRPRHARSAPQRLATPLLVIALALGTGGAGAFTAPGAPAGARSHSHSQVSARLATFSLPGQLTRKGIPGAFTNAEVIAILAAESADHSFLPAASAPPLAAPPSLADSPPLQPHEVFAFAPYWSLPNQSQFALGDFTTVAYFGVDVAGNGALVQSGSGWNGFQSADLTSLITRAHRARTRVVLTVKCFSQSTLNKLTSDANAPRVLANQLISALESKRMDGVNFDFEGTGNADGPGLVRLITQVSSALRSVDPNWQITMDTYASSATSPGGFFDIPALAPAVNAFFVMAYDMENPAVPSPTAPLSGPGFTDAATVASYLSVVPGSKVILGVPFYGLAWSTTSNTLGAPPTGGPYPLSYDEIAAAGLTTYWDATTQTAWSEYQDGSTWYQIYYENPQSVALKAQLANSRQLAGVGAWALGMGVDSPAMLDALLGHAPALKSYSPGPTTSTGTGPIQASPGTGSRGPAPSGQNSPPPTSGTGGRGGSGSQGASTNPPAGGSSAPQRFRGDFEGQTVTLDLVSGQTGGSTSGLPATGARAGTIQNFTTNDATLACWEKAGALQVWTDPSNPDIGLATTPTSTSASCPSAGWTFSWPAGTAPQGSSGSAGSGSSSSTGSGTGGASSSSGSGSSAGGGAGGSGSAGGGAGGSGGSAGGAGTGGGGGSAGGAAGGS